jgi:hypothetical protein
MKKLLLFIAVMAFALNINAQGTWFATGTETTIAASTEISLGIANLKCMHSDAATAGVIGKADSGSPTVSYHGVDYTNQAIIQGATNGMYYAFIPSQSGYLDISIKMGSGKKTFAVQLTDNIYNTSIGDLPSIFTDFPTFDKITADYIALPRVYDTYTQKDSTWNGSVAIQSTGGNVYLVMSIPVVANKTYAVGVLGSKLMLRGINYIVGSAGVENAQAEPCKVYASSGKININGLTNEKVSVSDLMGRQMTVANPSEISVKPGLYMVKVNGKVTKIFVD